MDRAYMLCYNNFYDKGIGGYDSTMQDIIVKLNDLPVKISPAMVFHSRNPRSRRFGVNIYYREDGIEKWVQLFCPNEYDEKPARELSINIREGKITDLTGYLAERRIIHENF